MESASALLVEPFEVTTPPGQVSPRWGLGASAGILGWVLDSFDFFVLVFLVDVLAKHFGVDKARILLTITVTLIMRPVGALLLGSIADRFGRKGPLIGCVLYFSAITALTPFAPNYITFVVLRGLYGIGMGGYWGVGASLVLETAPSRWRGLFSGIMQAGYSGGYLFAALAFRAVGAGYGWRWMFLEGLAVALMIAVLTALTPEPASWKDNQLEGFGSIWPLLYRHKKSFLYLVIVMTAMSCLSHGTQDLYPDFLKTVHAASAKSISNIAILYSAGAILGSMIVGHFSDALGRRNMILLALALSFGCIPLWAFGTSLKMLALGAFFIQFGVMGTYGVIPAYLNELAPPALGSLFPGVVYQLGMLIGSPGVVIEFALQRRFGYQWGIAGFEICVISVLIMLFALAPEAYGTRQVEVVL